MFEVEALGLQELAQTKTLRIPETICYGINGSHAFLVLEYVDIKISKFDHAAAVRQTIGTATSN